MAAGRSATQLVFVPRIGFRAAGTRTLSETTETFAHRTRLTVLAAATAPDRTDIVVEWERDTATCTPATQVVAALRHDERAPLDRMRIALAVGARELKAIRSEQPSYSYGGSIRASQTMTFPALARDDLTCELRIGEAGQEWRVPLTLEPADLNARSVAAQVERDGVVVRATALGRYEHALVVALEVEATRQIRQVGWPVPTPVMWSGDDAELRRVRAREHRRFFTEHFGPRLAPITLEDDRGGSGEELQRLFTAEPQQSGPGQPFISRFSVMFEAPSAAARTATLVVPYVALNDPEHSATVDLRDAPVDVALGEHRFRVARAEAHGTDQRKVIMEIPPAGAPPSFVQPQRMQGADPKDVAWQGEPVDTESPGNVISMATTVGDPPIVTFQGVVLRVDGPWRLALN